MTSEDFLYQKENLQRWNDISRTEFYRTSFDITELITNCYNSDLIKEHEILYLLRRYILKKNSEILIYPSNSLPEPSWMRLACSRNMKYTIILLTVIGLNAVEYDTKDVTLIEYLKHCNRGSTSPYPKYLTE